VKRPAGNDLHAFMESEMADRNCWKKLQVYEKKLQSGTEFQGKKASRNQPTKNTQNQSSANQNKLYG
jgi:hypothetical protein